MSETHLVSTLSPQCRATVLYYVRVALKDRTRSTPVSNLRTFWSRHQFYFTDFIPIVKLDNTPLLLNIPQEDRNLSMAAYATFLLTRHTLMCMSIKVDTATLYLKSVNKIFFNNNQWYPDIFRTGDSAPVPKALFREAKRWEPMSNCQEPIIIDIIEHIIA